MDNSNGSKPVFDKSRMSWADAKRRDLAAARLTRFAGKITKSAELSDDEFDAALAGYSEALATIEEQIAKTLVSVPTDWLVEGAPAVINWSEPAALNWIREDCMMKIRSNVTESENAGN